MSEHTVIELRWGNENPVRKVKICEPVVFLTDEGCILGSVDNFVSFCLFGLPLNLGRFVDTQSVVCLEGKKFSCLLELGRPVKSSNGRHGYWEKTSSLSEDPPTF